MSWKDKAYYSGPPPMGGLPPLPPEISASRKRQMQIVAVAAALVLAGALMGLWLAPEGPKEVRARLAATQKLVETKQARIGELEQQVRDLEAGTGRGKLRPADRARHDREGKRYVAALRAAHAQSAADLMAWFIGRWNQLLDFPQPDDRTGRRAAALSLLVGGMAANLNPGDYVPWQAEFFNNSWLGDLHFDLDGDGLPGKRSAPNTHDGFANVSVCHVAEALNQAVRDARVLMMPEMRCDRADNRMSVFLQGATFDDALNEFVRAVREQRFIVVEKTDRAGMRLILVGNRPPPPKDD